MARRNNSLSSALIVRIAACFLCLVLVGASLDTIPDPPAITTPGNQLSVASPASLGPPLADAAAFAATLLPINLLPHTGAHLPSDSGESLNHICDGTILRHAADTSPPFYS